MFNKNLSIIIFLIIIAVLSLSCGNRVSNEANNDSDTDFNYLYSQFCEPTIEYTPTDYSAFNNQWAAIIEFGEQIFVDSDEGVEPAYFSTKLYGEEEKYIAYSIRIHKIFSATAKKSGFPHDSVIYSNIIPGRMHTLLNEVADYYNKSNILSEYDDIILMGVDSSEEILIGGKYFVFLEYLIIEYPHSYFGSEIKDAWTWRPKNLEIIQIFDKKICLPESFYDKTTQGDYVYSLANRFEEANGKLVEVGITDNLFRNSMTIEELEEYFGLVTNKETFAPLFENTSSSDTP